MDKKAHIIRDDASLVLCGSAGQGIQTVEKIMKDFNRDYWMNAEESLEYGIVDGILE